MKIKKFGITNLLLIILLINNIISQVTVYPEHYLESDSPYSSSTLFLSSDIKERQIYKLGYFTTSNSNIKSYKFGLIYTPDNYCVIDTSDTPGILQSSSNPFLNSIDRTSTRVKNFSEELKLLENYCAGQELIINAPFPTLHNTGYILKYKLSMTNSGSSTPQVKIKVNLQIIQSGSINELCQFAMEKDKADWFKMTIKSKLSSTNKITMMFQCEGENDFISIDVNTDDKFKLVFNSDDTNLMIYISFYQVLLEDSTSSYYLSYNDNKIIRTYNGMEQCNINDNEYKCLIGYFCNGQRICEKCDESCHECSGSGGCLNCGVLTDVDSSGTGLGNTCKKNYIDLSNFEDIYIDVPLIDKEFHERSTFGFWIFIADMSKARTGNSNIYHVVLKDRYVLSIIPNEISTGVYCHAYEDLYRTITSETMYESHYTDREGSYVLYRAIPSDEQLKYINGRDLSGQWFHVSCGLSFDHKMYHVTTVVNGEDNSIERALRHENLYYDSAKKEYVENDIYNRHIIGDNNNLKLEFRNFGKAGTKIYLKYFLLFQEYIPPSFKFMYFDFNDAFDDTNKRLLLSINFNELKFAANLYQFDYNNINGLQTYTLKVSSLKETDLSPPKNFKLFVLPSKNEAYINVDCSTLTSNYKTLLDGTINGVINWDKDKPLFCANYLNTQEDICVDSGPCIIKGSKYISYPSPGQYSQGYCDSLCSGSMSCNPDYNPDNFCIQDHDYIYNLFYSCENKETKYYLQYSSFYNPEKIEIVLEKELESYIIEIWYYPDFFLSDTNRQGKFYNPETLKNYVFYSNVATAYFLHSEYKKLKVEDQGSTYTSDFYHPYEWNKLMFYGKRVGKFLYKYFIINNLVNDYIRFKLIAAENLKSIQFSTKIVQDVNTNYNWATGYYRDLKIWDGDMASPELVILYEYYYPNKQINALKYHFPLTNEYIADNKIKDIIANREILPTSGDKKLRKYNFSSKFDFIRSQYPSLQYYLIADATAPKAYQCAVGCLRCWNSGSNCYQCIEGYQLTLERACIIPTHYYFKSPCVKCNPEVNAELKIDQKVYETGVTSPVTVTFWVKIHGFKSNNPHNFVSYSANDHLKYYESEAGTTECQGLCLIDKEQVVASDPDFRDKIGKWTYIALSYYEEKSYYPIMINFEVNRKSMKIINYPPTLSFDKFTIYANVFAFFFNVRYYHEYLVGAYGYATNDGNLISPFSIPKPYKSFLVPGNTESNCFDNQDILDSNGPKFGCGGDYDKLFETFSSSFNNYIEIEKGYGQPKQCNFKNNDENAYCLNACKGSENIDCTCLNRNYNSQMLVKSDDGIFCKTFRYINFSKAKKIHIKVRTAKETKKFTLQFWIFFYNYKVGNFGGATFNWNQHNKIFVYKKEDNTYWTKCEIYTIENKKVVPKEIKEYRLDIEKWNFISCSINYEERLYYLNTNNDIKIGEENDELAGRRLMSEKLETAEVPAFIQNNDWTYLEITDNTQLDDWGYLFYRQIHLWKDAYFNAEFLSRVNILTPSKFPYLLHSWDTHFKGYKDGDFNNNFIIKDICNSADDIVVTKVDALGFNYITLTDFDKDVELCSEDGEYYDIYTITENHCLPFADLGLIDDFSFSDIPYSYSGTYSMAFWIFFEDSSTIGSGIHFQWERHLQITVIKLSQLQGYCLPQGYYSDDISNSQFTEKLNRIPNQVDSTLVTDDQSESGVWIWVLCSVSNYAKKFFLKGNGAPIVKDLIAEDLYFSDTTSEGQPVKNKYPYHFFMSEVNNGVSQTSKLNIEGIANEKRIYIRDLFLFNDYIPYEYAEAFKHIDLSAYIETQMMDSLIFACNFANFNLNKMTLTYYVINRQNSNENSAVSSTYTKTKKTVKLFRSNKISSLKTFELCSNFGFIKIVAPSEGDLCQLKEYTTDENKSYLTKIYYCNDARVPIVCRKGYYISINENGSPICHDSCFNTNYMRVPGTPFYSGICSIPADANIKTKPNGYMQLIDYSQNIISCDGKYNEIGYTCFDKEDDDKSAFFFSRCYNNPNIYGEISNEIKEKLPNGYYYEFWFKLDKVQILQHCETTANEEYILYSVPHSIYLDLKENKYYYKIIDSIYSSTLDGINDYEWNKIVIKTTLGVTLGQNVYVYINFDIDNIKATILNIPSSIKMQLQYISFCSKEENGDCTPAGAAEVTWGSAYYRNIRIWELYSSSIYSIQDFNIEIYTDLPLSLKLYYPLRIANMTHNILDQTIGGNSLDAIKVTHKESQNFKSYDNWDFYNYADNFDWGVASDLNKKKFISSMNGIQITSQDCNPNCERCYSNAITNCYKCANHYVLKGMTCVFAEKTYLKIPGGEGQIQFKINEDVPNYPGYVPNKPGITITFYMKFEGAYAGTSAEETNYHILELSKTTFLAYEPQNSNLEFMIESTAAFRYNNYYNLIGQWVPYSIAIYKGDYPVPDRYPHMFTFSVNKEDIPFINGYSLPQTLSRIQYLNLGDKVIALFADLRIYNTFIQGSFGHAISKTEKGIGLILHYSLTGASETDCISPDMLSDPTVSIKCVTDYTDYMVKDCGTDINKYFDLSIPGDKPCGDCPDYCKTKCFNPNNNQCTCDMTHGLYWLRRDKTTRQTYCEYLPSIDFSILNDVEMRVPTSQNFESTVEFWVFIYSYNSETSQFNSISIEWNLHNKVLIKNEANTLYAYCWAFYDVDNPDRYTEKLTLSISGYSWLYIRCGTDYISRQKKYFLNNQEEELKTSDYPDRTSLVTSFKISSGGDSSFGYVFLRDIKLWQQYNFNYINTQYINLVDDVGLYDANIKKSTGLYPGLITYIKSEFDPSLYEQTLNNDHVYTLQNLVGKDVLGYTYLKTYNLTRKNDFLGYNIVDPDNYGYYSDFIICNEGYVYNSENNMCIEVTVTKCRYPGDVSDNCISCPDETPYIYPPNGNCVNDCGVRFYKRDDINQCRSCHYTCYECWSYEETNCISCIDDRYLVETEHRCVLDCLEYGLVVSPIVPNKCVSFIVDAEIVNYNISLPIDTNTFDFLVAEVTNISAKNYFGRWSFDAEETRRLNPGKRLNFEDGEVPFLPNDDENLERFENLQNNLKRYNVSLNHSFFELDRKYVFTLDITAYNILDITKQSTEKISFTLIMNSHPKPIDAGIEIIPSVGLHNTTIFVLRCQNWTDDTCETSDLTYYFYAKEDLSTETIMIKDWSSSNEISYKFILEKDSLPKNNITVYCKARDNYMAEYEVSKNITIVTDLSTGVYNLGDDLKDYYLPDRQLQKFEMFHLSQLLMSMGQDLYKVLRPTQYQSIYSPSIDKTLVVMTPPQCITFNKECNYLGECIDIADEFIACRCKEGYIGTNCHIDKNGGAKLLDLYKELYTKLLSTLQMEITYEEFKVIHNLFNGAKHFAEDPSFFSNQLETFLTMAMNVYPKSIDNNTYEYIDLLDFYFSYEYERLNKKRVNKQFNTGLNLRDLPIDKEDQYEFKEAFEYIHNELINLIHFKCNMHINTQIDYEYSSDNFYIAIKSVNPTFDEAEFFEERKQNYKSFPRFMTCLNYIENNRLNNPYFQTFMIYIEYLKFPFGYDESIYNNNTSPLIEIRFLDATTGKNFDLSDCTGANQININTPFTNYRSLDKLNDQKPLFDPRNYKSPSDPIFSDPIYINKSGFVSDDTVEQRIAKYHRKYNISCRYFDIENMVFSDTGLTFTNFTSDTNFIQFNTTHLSRFSTFLVDNNATFKVKGRFFYVPRTELLNWKDNFSGNFGFIVFLISIIAYASLSLILGCYDNIYFVKETLLESLKTEIVKSFLPYKGGKEKEKEASKLVPVSLDPNLIDEKKFGDKTKENKRYEDNDETKNDEDILNIGRQKDKGLFAHNTRKSLGSSDRLFDANKINKSKEFLSRKNKNKVQTQNIMTTGNKTDLNLALETKDYYTSNVGKNEISHMNVNRMPEIFEDPNVEYNRRLYGYANLNLNFFQYLIKNILARNILINPFLNINMFCPRWKKLIFFTTNVLSELLLLSVFLTDDENALHTNKKLLLRYSIFTVLITDTFMHFMAIFFQFSGRQKRRLLRLVLHKGQLIVMKEYEDMLCINAIFTVFGTLICYGIWGFTFYMSFAFYSVWKVQRKAYVFSFFMTILIDFVGLDLFYELFLAIIYMQRQSSRLFRVLGEFLNRLRNHRCLA